jgi:hypothetical protein
MSMNCPLKGQIKKPTRKWAENLYSNVVSNFYVFFLARKHTKG